MIYPTAYDTTAGRMYSSTVKKLTDKLQEQLVNHDLKSDEAGDDVSGYLVIGAPEDGTIPLFAHSLAFKDVHKKECLVTDVRPFVTYSPENAERYFVKNNMEYELALARHKATRYWLTRRPQALRDMSHVPLAVFTSWVSESVARRYALEVKDQVLLAIVSGFFYLGLFQDKTQFDEEDLVRMSAQITRATKAPGQLVMEVADQLESMANVEDFCAVAKQIVANTRLEDFNAGLLITIVGNTWFGANAKEILAVALEHPPTWLSLVYIALKERSYKNTSLAKIALRYALNKGGNDFIRSFVSACL